MAQKKPCGVCHWLEIRLLSMYKIIFYCQITEVCRYYMPPISAQETEKTTNPVIPSRKWCSWIYLGASFLSKDRSSKASPLSSESSLLWDTSSSFLEVGLFVCFINFGKWESWLGGLGWGDKYHFEQDTHLKRSEPALKWRNASFLMGSSQILIWCHPQCQGQELFMTTLPWIFLIWNIAFPSCLQIF